MFEAFRCVKALGDKGTVQRAGSKRSGALEADHGVPAKRPMVAAPSAKKGLDLEKLGDQPLRLILVGHNPSDHAWSSGHYYSNPNNWMWRILKETGIAPEGIRGAEDDGLMPQLAGVGFTDVGSGAPGTQSSQFKAQHFDAWRQPFFERLRAHMQRASATVGCTCGRCGAPAVVAFAGKRQFQELFQGPPPRAAKMTAVRPQQSHVLLATAGAADHGEHPPPGAAADCAVTLSPAPAGGGELPAAPAPTATAPPPLQYQRRRPGSVAAGRQGVLPEGWPLPPSTDVWVLPSTSGAAAMTRGQRLGPWQELAQQVQQEPWPRGLVPCCRCHGEG